jgi:hypothetical protein
MTQWGQPPEQPRDQDEPAIVVAAGGSTSNRRLPTMADLGALAAELDEVDAALARMDADSGPQGADS